MKNSAKFSIQEENENDVKIITTVVERIYNTMDYMKYNLLGSNRPIKEAHVKVLVESFTKFGSSLSRLIVVKTKALSSNGKYEFYLIDGQHTRLALHRLGLPVDVVIIEISDDTSYNLIKTMAMLNNSNKAWTPIGYIKAYADLDIYEYKVLYSQIKETGLTPSDVLRIYLGKTPFTDYKKGSISFVDENRSEELLKATVKIRPYTPNKSFVRRSFFNLCDGTCNFEKFSNAIITQSKALNKLGRKYSESETEFKNDLQFVFKSFKIGSTK